MARPTPELLDPARYRYIHEVPTRYADVDPQHHINNVAMAAAFEDARVRFDHMKRGDYRYDGLRVMIVAAYIDYLAEAHFPGSLFIHMGVLEIGRSSWTVAQLAMQDDRPRAFCRSTLAARNADGAAPLPDFLREWLEQHRIDPNGGTR